MEAKLPINAAPSQTNDMNAAFTRTLGRSKEGRKEGRKKEGRKEKESYYSLLVVFMKLL